MKLNWQKPIYTYAFDQETTLQLFDVDVLPQEKHNPTLTMSTVGAGACVFNKRTGNLDIRCTGDTQISVGRVKQKNRNLIPAKEWWIGVRDFKKPEGLVSFHMGPHHNPELHPAFVEPQDPKQNWRIKTGEGLEQNNSGAELGNSFQPNKEL